MKSIESVVAERQAKPKPSTAEKDSAPCLKRIGTVKENDTKWTDPEKSESFDSDDSDDVGRKNKPRH